jgi:hypothetical protein
MVNDQLELLDVEELLGIAAAHGLVPLDTGALVLVVGQVLATFVHAGAKFLQK